MRLLFLLIFCCLSLPARVHDVFSKDEACEYEKYAVKVKIVSVKNLPSSKSSGPTGYEIRFVVLSPQELPKIIENRSFNRDYLMLLSNKTFPGALFIKQYEISTDKILDGYYHLLTRGTCRPGFFEFPDINLSDDPESEIKD